jgi:hypothetical protein
MQRNGFPAGNPFVCERRKTAEHAEKVSGQVQDKDKRGSAFPVSA